MAKKPGTTLVVGTRKGLFTLSSLDRKRWRTSGPHYAGLSIHNAFVDPNDGRTIHAAVESMHWGPIVAHSKDVKTWKRHAGPKYAEGTGLSVARIWSLAAGQAPGELYAGVEPAGLFRSQDGGANWESLDGLNAWPGREKWMAGGGGLNLHTILPYPEDQRKMVVGASSVGVFGTGDGGKSWRLMNAGINSPFSDSGATGEGEAGSCVHKMVRDARDPDLLYMQNHWGVYRRRRGDEKWTDISKGLPSRFGFPIAAHPHDAGTAYTVPLEADTNRVAPKGAFAVYRTRNGGKAWHRLAKGLPQKGAWHTVLREALATDNQDKAGVYVGTTTGEVYASRDDGDAWSLIADRLPPILTVRAS